MNDPFEALAPADGEALFDGLAQRSVGGERAGSRAAPAGVVTARLHGFALDDAPVLAGLASLPGELVQARAVAVLRGDQIGAQVVVVFEEGDPRRPIVLGVLQDTLAPRRDDPAGSATVTVIADDARHEIRAEREIVLRCGEASITLTRAGKVLIEGKYVVSRSRGVNKIKGAAVEIN